MRPLNSQDKKRQAGRTRQHCSSLFERVGLYDCVQLQVGCLTPFFQRRKLSQDEDARAGRILRACVLACFFREKMHFTAELEPAWELDIAKCNDLIRVRALKNSHR
jgi:hypothetical protein